jgi:hypothetical protein
MAALKVASGGNRVTLVKSSGLGFEGHCQKSRGPGRSAGYDSLGFYYVQMNEQTGDTIYSCKLER